MSKETRERSFSQDDVNRIVEERLARDRAGRAVDDIPAGRSVPEMRASLGFPPGNNDASARLDARVVSEPRVYSLDSPHSYYADTILTRMDPHAITHPEAHARMNRYAGELAHEMEKRSAEGLRAERVIREGTRERDKRIHERRYQTAIKEVRAVTTGGGTTATAASQAAAFVPPAFLTSDYALYRDNYRTFADQCHLLPLPPYGMEVYLPAFLTPAAEAQQTELSGVAETDPSTNLQGSPVITVAGQITITQQLEDRFALGGAADVVFARQLRQHLGAKLDLFALNQVITAAAPPITDSTPFGANSLAVFLADLSKGREQITDTAGVRLRPTHFFSTYDFYSFVSDQVGTDGRPLLTINESPGVPIQNYPAPTGADDGPNGGGDMPKWARFTGVVLPGSVLWFTDDNLPPSGSNNQLIVSAPDQSVVVMESPEPALMVSPQTYAGSLAIVVSLYEYASVITRHASGSAVITGSTYPSSDK